jgi:hypothetical protein
LLTNTNASIEYMNEMNDKIINLDNENSFILPPIDKSKRNNSHFTSKTMQKTQTTGELAGNPTNS